MTLLVTSIAADNLGELESLARRAWEGGTEGVEIRLDAYTDDPHKLAAYLAENRNRTWIVTCRSETEGGAFIGDTSERVSLLLAVAGPTDAYVDFEFADWRRSANIQQKVALAAPTHRLILSAHDFEGIPADLRTIVNAMSCEGRRLPIGGTGLVDQLVGQPVAKVAYRGASIADSFLSLDLLHERGRAMISICMGEEGLWSRVLAKKLGAFASYCALSTASVAAPGQITLDEMIHLYRWDTLDASTRVFGVVGDPIAHSMGPLLFNRWFAEMNVNAVYLPLRVRLDDDCLERFLNGCIERPWLDVGGFSVTLPHKTSALAWLGNAADLAARSIGAVNTLTFLDGKKAGYNTDCQAAVASLISALACSPCDLADLPVDVLGTGGAARAMLAGLGEVGCATTVFGRSAEKTRRLGEAFGCRPAAWEDRTRRTGEILINATSVGMWPDSLASPIPGESLVGCRLVFDLIYNPIETALLKDAKAAGATVLSGLDMFVRQAAMQFELWTHKTPDTRLAKQIITREIQRRANVNP